ncbi:hypothetical protein ATE47_03765 [Chryseobacterium sp. IHB B 17019]|nr:hypothetical protein ATE47_03765 [Chryseobacterium sp. IHB B 17019]
MYDFKCCNFFSGKTMPFTKYKFIKIVKKNRYANDHAQKIPLLWEWRKFVRIFDGGGLKVYDCHS